MTVRASTNNATITSYGRARAGEVCEAVLDVFKPTEENSLILNLPDTVDMPEPNLYAA